VQVFWDHAQALGDVGILWPVPVSKQWLSSWPVCHYPEWE